MARAIMMKPVSRGLLHSAWRASGSSRFSTAAYLTQQHEAEQRAKQGVKVLLTPGPLNCSATVKEAMLRDMGSRDEAFIKIIQDIREKLLGVAGVSPESFVAVPMQGSGTFGVEATVTSVIPPDGKLLVISNGAYGVRMATMAKTAGIPVHHRSVPENRGVSPADLQAALAEDPAITHVGLIHSETTTGVLNPLHELGPVVKGHGKVLLVDAMSSFGAVDINFAKAGIDFLVSSSNKCIEGVPGFAFTIANKQQLQATKGWARSLSLDLLSQCEGLDANGQFRFTPPTHSLLAFHQALLELEEEGGVAARAARYANNHAVLKAGMKGMGFQVYLEEEHQGPIITSFLYPNHPNFDFKQFYLRLSDLGFVIYPGKLSEVEVFRLGNIGRLFQEDMEGALQVVSQVLKDMEVQL